MYIMSLARLFFENYTAFTNNSHFTEINSVKKSELSN